MRRLWKKFVSSSDTISFLTNLQFTYEIKPSSCENSENNNAQDDSMPEEGQDNDTQDDKTPEEEQETDDESVSDTTIIGSLSCW